MTKRERERERERQIQQLRTRIAELEAITNKTAEQKVELNSKRQELAKLEREKQKSQDPKKTNWTPWLIGGVILVLVLVIGIVAYLWGENNKNNQFKK